MESDLPLEVLSHILSYLAPLQRLSAGLVCRRWLQASSSLLEDVALVFRGAPSIPLTGRTFPRLVLHSTIIDDHCIDYFDTLGPTLLHLRFAGECCVRTDRKATACLRLRTLETSFGDALLVFAAIPRLRSLNLKHGFALTDHTLAAFDKVAAPDLEFFAMPDDAVYERLVLKRFYPEGTTLESGPSSCLVSRAALEAFVARRAATLTTLHFPKTITPDAVLFLSRLPVLKLRRVSFAHCSREIAEVVPEFCRHQPSIVSLDLDALKGLGDQHVMHICELLPDLREFSCREGALLDWAVIPLFRLRCLRSLRLGSCSRVTSVAFFAALPSAPMLELRSLDLSHTRIPKSHLRVLLSCTPLLEKLDLGGCDVSDATLSVLPRPLRTLSLGGCGQLSDAELSEGLRNLRLEKLVLRACSSLTSAGIVDCVQHLRHLKELDVSQCSLVSPRDLEPIRVINPCITQLRVS